MPLAYCQGTCGRMISISTIPGGNPEALAHPESFAIEYVACRACRRMYCDRCAPATGGRCACGMALAMETEREKERAYDKGSRAMTRIARWLARAAAAGGGGAGTGAESGAGAGAGAGGPRFLAAPPLRPEVAKARDLMRRAVEHVGTLELTEAEACLNGVIAIDPRHADALACRGWMRQLRRALDGARADFTAALAAAPAGWGPREDVEEDLTDLASPGDAQ